MNLEIIQLGDIIANIIYLADYFIYGLFVKIFPYVLMIFFVVWVLKNFLSFIKKAVSKSI